MWLEFGPHPTNFRKLLYGVFRIAKNSAVSDPKANAEVEGTLIWILWWNARLRNRDLAF